MARIAAHALVPPAVGGSVGATCSSRVASGSDKTASAGSSR